MRSCAQPLAECRRGGRLNLGESKPGAARLVGPGHNTGGVDYGINFRKFKSDGRAAPQLQRRITRHANATLADIAYPGFTPRLQLNRDRFGNNLPGGLPLIRSRNFFAPSWAGRSTHVQSSASYGNCLAEAHAVGVATGCVGCGFDAGL